MKTFQQFQEGIGKLRILPTLAKGAAATYAIKKGAEFLGRKSGESDVKNAQPKKPSKPKYQNPSDGSIPARRKDESLQDYYKRRNQGYKDQIDKM